MLDTCLCVFSFGVKAKLKIPAAKGCCFAERRARRSLFLKQRAADRSLPPEPKVPGHNRGAACEPRLRQTVFHPVLDGMKTSLSPFYDLNVQSGLGRPADLTYLMEEKKIRFPRRLFL